jgi:RNA polymerase sigma factor (TIGR02999 family)
MRLIDWKNVEWQNRAHFFEVAAQMMRRILVDFARARRATRRGGSAAQVSLDEVAFVSADQGAELIALDEALEKLAEFDARKSQIVEMRFFGDLSVAETAEVMKLSPRTVKREWGLELGDENNNEL